MIEIITDSTSDIPAGLAERCAIQVLPAAVYWDGQTYRDRVDLSPEAFYARLRAGGRAPTTGSVGPGQFAEAYARAAERGASAAVVITVASNLSASAAAASQAAQDAPIPVHIHEAGGTTMGNGFQALAAARASQQGAGLAEVLAEAARVRRRVRAMALLDTLDYAFQGGRLSRASWMIGTLLNIKGVFCIDHSCGQVKVLGRAHGQARALDLLFERFFDGLGDPARMHVAVLHGDAEEAGRGLLERVRAQVGPAELFFSITGPVLGTHTGPGALALAGYADE